LENPAGNGHRQDASSKDKTKMQAALEKFCSRKRCGAWLPHDPQHIETFLAYMHAAAAKSIQANETLVEPIQDLQDLVSQNTELKRNVEAMFTEANEKKAQTPLNTPGVTSFNEFLHMLNLLMKTAPAYYAKSKADHSAAGLVGFPINALLDWPMATNAGFAVFQNMLFNRQFKKILSYWAVFLGTPDSRYVLTTMEHDVLGAPVLPWLHEDVKRIMCDVAFQWTGKAAPASVKFEDVFKCDPEKDDFYGFKSWDDFFTREFKDDIRPVGGPKAKGVTKPWPNGDSNDDIILNACESAPLQIKYDVKLHDKFWLKGQPYSIEDMFDFDSRSSLFEGGTVYQAFLSALSYHRWNSPVNGTIDRAFVVNGSYYLQSAYEGFDHTPDPDDVAPNDSQPYLTAVATRAVIFIKADNPAIGLMCLVAVGMAEVSSCEITVMEGQSVKKGDQLGMFHFGGSTHCLLFRPDVKLEFVDFDKEYHTGEVGLDAYNVPVKAELARVVKKPKQ